jgi:hypothetical protein
MTAPRPLPTDFVEVFLEIGWDGIQYHYRTHNSTIARWINEAGGEALRQRRAEIVRLRRAKVHVIGKMPEPVNDGIAVDVEIVAAAAHFLRTRSAGGWMVSATGKGDWRVGTMRKTPAQLVAMAEAKGFDPSVMQVMKAR